LDISVLVQELDESFEASNVALKACKSILDHLSIFSGHFLGLSLHVSKNDSDHLNDGEDQRTKGN